MFLTLLVLEKNDKTSYIRALDIIKDVNINSQQIAKFRKKNNWLLNDWNTVSNFSGNQILNFLLKMAPL